MQIGGKKVNKQNLFILCFMSVVALATIVGVASLFGNASQPTSASTIALSNPSFEVGEPSGSPCTGFLKTGEPLTPLVKEERFGSGTAEKADNWTEWNTKSPEPAQNTYLSRSGNQQRVFNTNGYAGVWRSYAGFDASRQYTLSMDVNAQDLPAGAFAELRYSTCFNLGDNAWLQNNSSGSAAFNISSVTGGYTTPAPITFSPTCGEVFVWLKVYNPGSDPLNVYFDNLEIRMVADTCGDISAEPPVKPQHITSSFASGNVGHINGWYVDDSMGTRVITSSQGTEQATVGAGDPFRATNASGPINPPLPLPNADDGNYYVGDASNGITYDTTYYQDSLVPVSGSSYTANIRYNILENPSRVDNAHVTTVTLGVDWFANSNGTGFVQTDSANFAANAYGWTGWQNLTLNNARPSGANYALYWVRMQKSSTTVIWSVTNIDNATLSEEGVMTPTPTASEVPTQTGVPTPLTPYPQCDAGWSPYFMEDFNSPPNSPVFGGPNYDTLTGGAGPWYVYWHNSTPHANVAITGAVLAIDDNNDTAKIPLIFRSESPAPGVGNPASNTFPVTGSKMRITWESSSSDVNQAGNLGVSSFFIQGPSGFLTSTVINGSPARVEVRWINGGNYTYNGLADGDKVKFEIETDGSNDWTEKLFINGVLIQTNPHMNYASWPDFVGFGDVPGLAGNWPSLAGDYFHVEVCNAEQPTATATGVPPTATATATGLPPTETATGVPPTATATATGVPPTETATGVPPTPTATVTGVPPTATATGVPPTPTPTATSVTSTPTPTGTFFSPTPTATSSAIVTEPSPGGGIDTGTNASNLVGLMAVLVSLCLVGLVVWQTRRV